MIVDFKFKADQKLTEADIIAFESRIGKTLPEDYRQHMLEWNGGGVHQLNLEHKKYPEDGDFGLENFYSIDYNVNTIESLMEFMGNALEENCILIGSTRGGGISLCHLKAIIHMVILK
ncbi:SMI1/KNR4 family protein [Tenacibaculum tangerinum]|uniref:SMI1/KNR4 family protein n=1 Tax=Tenacibaculum tangerinum TaxID=3038772 RepID=A0ABY8L1X6_9FLAO|nr:SMI1/KNR4 family protein [Tenacibaculum tangerinum]WGH75106.1 SMI1/KNR4 family protein [Tenacibaculum tangerinum]